MENTKSTHPVESIAQSLQPDAPDTPVQFIQRVVVDYAVAFFEDRYRDIDPSRFGKDEVSAEDLVNFICGSNTLWEDLIGLHRDAIEEGIRTSREAETGLPALQALNQRANPRRRHTAGDGDE